MKRGGTRCRLPRPLRPLGPSPTQDTCMIIDLTHVRTGGARASCLSTVLASPAPDALKATIHRLHTALADLPRLDDAAMRGLAPGLLRDLAALPSTPAANLDFLRALRGEPPERVTHSWRNVSALLRGKAGQLSRPLTDADFPPGHHVSLLALAYWGGVTAWSAGAAGRAQKPKSFWQDRANQIAALRQFAADNPTTPITSGTLNAAGLHRLAQLSADQLTALAAEAGLDRKLLHLPDGHWTVERVIDAYAAECRKAGATLSTVALAALGGAALSLRAYAQRHFPRFRDFQRAVLARHPDIKLPGRPTTRDGVVLDSWQEVACHQGMRHALPDARIDVHVILPGERQRSGDFLVDGRVWVEVLGLAVADMAAPRTAREGKYAAQ